MMALMFGGGHILFVILNLLVILMRKLNNIIQMGKQLLLHLLLCILSLYRKKCTMILLVIQYNIFYDIMT